MSSQTQRDWQVDVAEAAAPEGRRRGRPKVIGDDERRRAIMAGAREAFAESGFAHTTTAMIAAKARVSKRSIYEHFANKIELFAEIVRHNQHLILDLPRPTNETLPVLETMFLIFRLNIDADAQREREALLNLIVRESVLMPELSDYLYDNNIIRSREDLIEWLQVEAARGRMRVEDPLVCAGMLMDMVFGALLPRRRIHKAAEREERLAHIRKRLAIFVRGIGGEG